MYTFPLSWVEISAGALAHNVRLYKQLVGNTMLAPVIKSNAYGHGLFEIAQLLQNSPDVDWLCVANLSDAVALREKKITKNMLVLGYCDVSPELAAQHAVHVTVYNMPMMQHLSDVAISVGKKISVHLKVDTGLSRLGFFPHELFSAIECARNLPGIEVAGIGSHFAESYHEQQAFTQQQAQVFDNVLAQLEQKNISIPVRHVANSAGAFNVVAPRCNLVRVGAGIYGLWPSEFTKISAQKMLNGCELKPVLTWKTRIIELRELPPHIPVGYDRTHTTTRATKTAIVPIGYFDGYSRRLSNCGIMRVRGKNAPVLGRVSMNMTTLDVTNVDGVNIGDEVSVIGAEEEICPKKIAQLTGGLNQREVVALVHKDIPRVVVG